MSHERNPTPTARTRAPRKSTSAQAKSPAGVARFVGPEQRAALIAEVAYYRAEKRGFAPGQEVGDWLAAEAEVDARLLRAAGGTPRA